MHLSVTTRDHQELEQEGLHSSHAYSELIKIGYLVDRPRGGGVSDPGLNTTPLRAPGCLWREGRKERKEKDHMTGTAGHWHGGLR